MKNLKVLAVVMAALTAFAFVGCSISTQNDGTVVFKDMTDREIKLDAPAERIVALTAADCEIVYALGAGDKLVGRGKYCDYPEDVLAVAEVESGSETNVEQIIALNPQVVLMSTMDQTTEQVAALEEAGIKVVVSAANDIDGVYAAIEMIGKVVGMNDEATKLVESMKTSFEQIRSKATGDGTKTVYFEVSPLQYGLWTAGSGTFMDEIAAMLGLKNAFADISGWAEISEEQVIERNPDYIVTISMYYGDGPTPVEEIVAREGWQNITAIKENRVFNSDSNAISRPGPRLVDAAEALFKFVYEDIKLDKAA